MNWNEKRKLIIHLEKFKSVWFKDAIRFCDKEKNAPDNKHYVLNII